MSPARIFNSLINNLDWRPKQFFWTWLVVGLEAYGRFLGWRDYRNRRDHTVWEIAKSTKELNVTPDQKG
jgi:hypothetical protein